MDCLSSIAKTPDPKSKRPVTKSASVENKDGDETSSLRSATKTPTRKTPAQVKAESAARKAKVKKPLTNQIRVFMRRCTELLRRKNFIGCIIQDSVYYTP